MNFWTVHSSQTEEVCAQYRLNNNPIDLFDLQENYVSRCLNFISHGLYEETHKTLIFTCNIKVQDNTISRTIDTKVGSVKSWHSFDDLNLTTDNAQHLSNAKTIV